MDEITATTGRGCVMRGDDIDTDRIIPARFMKGVTFDGLGEFAFYDVRFDPSSGERTDHPLNEERFNGASVLLAGVNFGCGSSREHAPQSLNKYGFKSIIAESFAEIFFGNSTTLGMPCVTLTADQISLLREAVEADPTTEVTVDVDKLEVRSSAGHTFNCAIPDSARDALINGRWDPIQELLDNEEKTSGVGEALPYV